MKTSIAAKAHDDETRVTVVPPGGGENVWFLDTLVTVKLRGADGAELGVLESVLPAGHRTPFHCHTHEAEAFYVLEGTLTVFLGPARRLTATPGTFLHVPRGVPHGLRADERVRVLVLSDPNGFVEFTREVGAPAPRAELPPPGTPDVARLAALGAKYHIELLGPLPE